MRILFLGDVVGRSGARRSSRRCRACASATRARFRGGQRRERRRRLRHHRADPDRAARRRRRRRDHRQSRVGTSARRSCSSSVTTACCGRSIFRQARRAGAPVCSRRKTGADVLVINAHGPRVHGRSRCPFRAVERELEACGLKTRRRRDRDRLSRRGHLREAGHGLFRRRAGERGDRHAYPCADGRRADPQRRHRLYQRCRHVRRLRFGARHEQAGAAAALPHQDPDRPLRSRHRAKPRCAASPSRSTMHGAGAGNCADPTRRPAVADRAGVLSGCALRRSGGASR